MKVDFIQFCISSPQMFMLPVDRLLLFVGCPIITGLLVRAAAPFIVLMLACLALVVWQPWIAMYLVNGKF